MGGRLQTVVNATTAGAVDALLAMLRREGAESVPFVGVFYTAGFSQKQLRSNTLERLGKGHVGGAYTLRVSCKQSGGSLSSDKPLITSD